MGGYDHFVSRGSSSSSNLRAARGVCGRALLDEAESVTRTSLATGDDERPCRISNIGGFNQTSMADKIGAKDDNTSFFGIERLLEDEDMRYVNLMTKALGVAERAETIERVARDAMVLVLAALRNAASWSRRFGDTFRRVVPGSEFSSHHPAIRRLVPKRCSSCSVIFATFSCQRRPANTSRRRLVRARTNYLVRRGARQSPPTRQKRCWMCDAIFKGTANP